MLQWRRLSVVPLPPPATPPHPLCATMYPNLVAGGPRPGIKKQTKAGPSTTGYTWYINSSQIANKSIANQGKRQHQHQRSTKTAAPTNSNNMRCGSGWNLPRRRWPKWTKSRRRWAANVGGAGIGVIPPSGAATQLHEGGGGTGPAACYTFSLLVITFTGTNGTNGRK